jgi:hypothetical protein
MSDNGLACNYCVNCGERTDHESHLCRICDENMVLIPTLYSNIQTYYCSYCGCSLDRYFDFEVDGTFSDDDFQCRGCRWITPEFDKQRSALPEMFHFINKNSGRVPYHVGMAWERQYNSFISKMS